MYRVHMVRVMAKVCTLVLQQAELYVVQAVLNYAERSKGHMVNVAMLVSTAGVAAVHALSSKRVVNCYHLLSCTTAKARVCSVV
jgi:hypothetical protein